MIPENKLIAVKNALQETFGVNEFKDIKKLTAGLSSALVFRIVVKEKPYLLRIITHTDAMADPTNQFACMKAAADEGLAPRIWYLNIQDRISITDFVEARTFPVGVAKIKLADLLSHLHSLPPFPLLKSGNYLDSMEGFIKKFKEANILPENMTEELFKQYTRVASVYPCNDEDLVSCHNDLKPENILFDGERAWLVDWEAAFLNDRYFDLAVVANFVVRNDKDEEEYLRGYFKEEVNEYRYARFFLARQLSHMFYLAVFMLFATKGKAVDLNMEKLDFRDFHDRIWAGGISLDDDESKLQYALVHMEKFLLNVRTKRFEDSLRIVANYH